MLSETPDRPNGANLVVRYETATTTVVRDSRDALFGLILWLSRWYRRDGKLKPEETLRDFVEVAVNSVLTTPAHAGLDKTAAARAYDGR